jgi:subtilisin family serine protease
MRINRTASLCLSFALLASVVVGYSTTASAAGNPNCDAVDGDYIVSFTPGVNVDKEMKASPGRAIGAKYRYSSALNGFAATLSAEQVCAFEKRPNIQFVEKDAVVSTSVTQTGTTWGLDRIDQLERINPLDEFKNNAIYNYVSSGDGVDAYIIDTGIYTAHPEFEGRARVGTDTLGGNGQDCDGHGTHVAGTVGSKTWGVAKKVNLIGVRVLNCRGSGTTASVVAGVDWVVTNHVDSKKAVANMSLGGGVSDAIDLAVSTLIADGVVTVVAAGNSTKDANTSSPARVSNAITVAASDKNDVLASFSNYGAKVDVIAPGVSIKSTWILSKRSPSLVHTISGTSMAAPHVAGVIARFLQSNSWTTGGVLPEGLLNPGKLTLTVLATSSGTPNQLIYMAP